MNRESMCRGQNLRFLLLCSERNFSTSSRMIEDEVVPFVSEKNKHESGSNPELKTV